MANLNLPEKAVRQQIASAVNVIVQVSRMSDGTRRVTHLSGSREWMRKSSACRIFSASKNVDRGNGRVLGRFFATGVTRDLWTKSQRRGLRFRQPF